MWLTVSSEQIAERQDGTGWEYFLHAPEAVNMELITHGLVILDQHRSGEPVAIIEKPELTNDTLGGEPTWIHTELGNLFREDAEQGKRENLSIECQAECRHERQVDTHPDGRFVFEVYYWTPRLAAFAPIPANPLVGIERDGTP